MMVSHPLVLAVGMMVGIHAGALFTGAHAANPEAPEPSPTLPSEPWDDGLPEGFLFKAVELADRGECKESIALLEAAGDAGDKSALDFLAMFLEEGFCTEEIKGTAESYRARAASLPDDCEANLRGAYRHMKNHGVSPYGNVERSDFMWAARCWLPTGGEIVVISRYWEHQDQHPLKVITEWISWALNVEAGDAETQFALAQRLAAGDGFRKSPETALRWMRQAVDKGLPDAQHALAKWYLYSEPVKKIDFTGMRRLEELARGGHVPSQAELGRWLASQPSPERFDDTRAYGGW